MTFKKTLKYHRNIIGMVTYLKHSVERKLASSDIGGDLKFGLII